MTFLHARELLKEADDKNLRRMLVVTALPPGNESGAGAFGERDELLLE